LTWHSQNGRKRIPQRQPTEFLAGKKRIGVIYSNGSGLERERKREREREKEKWGEKRRIEGGRIAEASEIFKGHNEEI